MMKKILPRLISLLMAIPLVACTMPEKGLETETSPNAVATMVAQTLAYLTESVVQASSVPPTVRQPTDTPTLEPTTKPSLTETPTITLTTTPTLTQTQTPLPSETPIPKPGTIAGGISGYPYGSIPRLAIVAFGQEPPYNYSYWITAPGSTYYEMTSQYLLPGKYQVVAYDAGNHKGGCLIIVTVKPDQTVNCDITDWGGSYPAKPSGVPDP
jgi:hypothetical protein